jgi:hypothetical protein
MREAKHPAQRGGGQLRAARRGEVQTAISIALEAIESTFTDRWDSTAWKMQKRAPPGSRRVCRHVSTPSIMVVMRTAFPRSSAIVADVDPRAAGIWEKTTFNP